MLGVLLGPARPARLLAATLFDHEAAAFGWSCSGSVIAVGLLACVSGLAEEAGEDAISSCSQALRHPLLVSPTLARSWR
jgi:hypothetical protein